MDTDNTKHYQTGDLTRTLAVSRASLLYYEEAGLVSPTKNPKTGLREYDNWDVFNLFGYKALTNLGLTKRQISSEAAEDTDLFDENHLEDYLAETKKRVAYDEALRDSVDRMRSIRRRDRLGPEVLIEYIERYIFIEDASENGYIDFHESKDLDLLVTCLPISGFGVLYSFDNDGDTIWAHGRTIPTRLSVVAGFRKHVPQQVGGCDCVTMISRTENDHTPPSKNIFDPLYRYAEESGRIPAGNPFAPYIFPPHPGTPYLLCLPLEDCD